MLAAGDNWLADCVGVLGVNLDVAKSLIGIISIAVATVSGISALLVDFRDKVTGRVTKWGRYAVFGLAASFFIGTINLWIDYVQKSKDPKIPSKNLKSYPKKFSES
jgi:hypothetical protein